MIHDKTLPVPRIQVRKFMGKNGGFAKGTCVMHICELVGVNGEIRRADPNNSYGHKSPGFAESDARNWSDLTGWPVVSVETRIETIDITYCAISSGDMTK